MTKEEMLSEENFEKFMRATYEEIKRLHPDSSKATFEEASQGPEYLEAKLMIVAGIKAVFGEE